eukprot:scaffold270115_cov43-Attheya_sp.AAC.1
MSANQRNRVHRRDLLPPADERQRKKQSNHDDEAARVVRLATLCNSCNRKTPEWVAVDENYRDSCKHNLCI